MVDSFGRAQEPIDQHHYANQLFCVLQLAQQQNSSLHGKEQERAQTLSDRMSQCSSILLDIPNTLNDDEFYELLVANMNTHLVLSNQRSKPQQEEQNDTRTTPKDMEHPT